MLRLKGKPTSKAEHLQSNAGAEGDLQNTTTTQVADKKYLAGPTGEQKATDFESRQQLRAEEIEAINKAIEIIPSNSVSGNADKHLPSLMQKAGALLAQLRSTVAASSSQLHVADYLGSQTQALNSRVAVIGIGHFLSEETPSGKGQDSGDVAHGNHRVVGVHREAHRGHGEHALLQGRDQE